jgi:hypothetical protein
MEATDLGGAPSDTLLVMQHLLKAMQARNNPLNRWFPWRQVCTWSTGVHMLHSYLPVTLLCAMVRRPGVPEQCPCPG